MLFTSKFNDHYFVSIVYGKGRQERCQWAGILENNFNVIVCISQGSWLHTIGTKSGWLKHKMNSLQSIQVTQKSPGRPKKQANKMSRNKEIL